MRRLLLIASLLASACGARSEIRGTGVPIDASSSDTSDFVPCGDAGACPASDSYCKIVSGGPPPGVTIHTCTTLPSGCHTCSCAAPPIPSQVCVCSSDSDEITVSCQVP